MQTESKVSQGKLEVGLLWHGKKCSKWLLPSLNTDGLRRVGENRTEEGKIGPWVPAMDWRDVCTHWENNDLKTLRQNWGKHPFSGIWREGMHLNHSEQTLQAGPGLDEHYSGLPFIVFVSLYCYKFLTRGGVVVFGNTLNCFTSASLFINPGIFSCVQRESVTPRLHLFPAVRKGSGEHFSLFPLVWPFYSSSSFFL